jgi:hypothetical protein
MPSSISNRVRWALKESLGEPSQIRDFLQMRWTLLLLITLFRTLAAQKLTDRDTWVCHILSTAGTEATDNKIRVRTGRMVASIVANSPWDLYPSAGKSVCDADLTINAVFEGIVEWTREINASLRCVSAEDRKKYDVDEAWSSDEDDEVELEQTTHKVKQPETQQQWWVGPSVPGSEPSPTYSNTLTDKNGLGMRQTRKPRSEPKSPTIIFWTPEESTALLKQYCAAPPDPMTGKPATHQHVTDLHNASFFPDGAKRTKHAVMQQLKSLGGRARIEEMREELAGELDGG